MAIELFQYQKEGVQYLLDNNRALLWDQQGLGKTIQVLYAIKYLKPKIVIIICPAIVTGVWEDEIIKVGLNLNAQVLATSKTKIRKGVNCIIISYDLVRKKLNLLLRITKKYEALVVCDEAHYIKNPIAKRTQNSYKVLSRAVFGWQLTGTPADKKALDFYLPIKFILGKKCISRLEFAKSFCNKVIDYNTGSPEYVGYRNQDVLKKYLKGKFLRRTMRQVHKDMPDKIIQEVKMNVVSPKDYIYAPPSEHKGVNSRRYKKLGLAKVKFSAEFIINILEGSPDEPVVVFAQHKRVIHLLAKKLKKYKPSIIIGETPKGKRNEIRKDFQKGKVRVLIANAEAASTGITLTRSRVVVFAELPHKGITYDQAMFRVFRIGQEKTCMIYKIIARSTLDVNINKMLEYKTSNSNEVISK